MMAGKYPGMLPFWKLRRRYVGSTEIGWEIHGNGSVASSVVEFGTNNVAPLCPISFLIICLFNNVVNNSNYKG
jgi:hypothetical protein